MIMSSCEQNKNDRFSDRIKEVSPKILREKRSYHEDINEQGRDQANKHNRAAEKGTD